MSVTIIIAVRVSLQKIFIAGDGAICIVKILVTVSGKIEPLFSFLAHWKLKVNLFVPFNRILIVLILIIPTADLEERFGSPGTLGKIPDDRQPVVPCFGERSVVLINTCAS